MFASGIFNRNRFPQNSANKLRVKVSLIYTQFILQKNILKIFLID